MKRQTLVFLVLMSSALTVLGYAVKKYTTQSPQKSIVVIIPSYNNKEWYTWNLDSLFAQKYDNWRAVYIDDCSPDGTGALVKQHIDKKGFSDRIELIVNRENKGALYNIYHAVHACNNNEIIVLLDGDDWFKHDHVLSKINKVYQDPQVWMTYGQFEEYPQNRKGFCCDWPAHIVKERLYRKCQWVTSHLRTFYAYLFKQVKLEDLKYNDDFFKVTWDQAFMFPLLEMSGTHYKFIDEILYVYNQANPLNDFKQRLRLQLYCEKLIRSKDPYVPLSEEEMAEVIA